MAKVADSSATLVATTAAVSLSAMLFLRMRGKKPRPLRETYDYGQEPPPPPLPLKLITSLPDFIRIPLLTKSAKPSPPRDAIDVLGVEGAPTPYIKRWEILPGKIWGVRYSYLIDPALTKMMESLMGNSDANKMKEAAIAYAPDHVKDTLANDFEVSDKYDAMPEEERAKLGGDIHQDMFVAKIEGGGLILYNPCRMHPEMIKWLDELGKVKFIVSGSSSHTNHLPGTAATFPDAKIICASAADAKCTAVGMRPADYLYDVTREDAANQPKQYSGRGTVEDAREELRGQAQVFHVCGDTCTQALLLVVHKHCFEVDLMYASSDEAKKEDAFDTGESIRHSKRRIFVYSNVSDKLAPVGYYLPIYRVWFMDPSCAMSKLGRDSPKKDGSSCSDMANSLRSILKVIRKPEVCERVHSAHAMSMSMDDFCRNIDKTWGWLDGNKS